MNTKCSDECHNSCTVAWNPFCLGKLGPDARCPGDSAMSKILLFHRGWFQNDSKSDFMRLIVSNITAGTCAALWDTLLRCPLITPLTAPLIVQPWCSYMLFLLCCLNTHPLSLSAASWKVWCMDSWSQKLPQQSLSENTKYLCFFISLPHLDLLLPVCLQPMADWTLVMLVCCWLRDEAPTRWLTCESSKVSLSWLEFESMLVVFVDVTLQLKWYFYYCKESKVLKETQGLGTGTELKVLRWVSAQI